MKAMGEYDVHVSLDKVLVGVFVLMSSRER
jgi:hypothetical protein